MAEKEFYRVQIIYKLQIIFWGSNIYGEILSARARNLLDAAVALAAPTLA